MGTSIFSVVAILYRCLKEIHIMCIHVQGMVGMNPLSGVNRPSIEFLLCQGNAS